MDGRAVRRAAGVRGDEVWCDLVVRAQVFWTSERHAACQIAVAVGDLERREVRRIVDGGRRRVSRHEANVEGTFALSMLADWGKANSVCEALWAAAETPDTTISVTMTAVTGAQFVFPILPEYPTAGGAGTDAQTVDFTFKIAKGEVVETFS